MECKISSGSKTLRYQRIIITVSTHLLCNNTQATKLCITGRHNVNSQMKKLVKKHLADQGYSSLGPIHSSHTKSELSCYAALYNYQREKVLGENSKTDFTFSFAKPLSGKKTEREYS